MKRKNYLFNDVFGVVDNFHFLLTCLRGHKFLAYFPSNNGDIKHLDLLNILEKYFSCLLMENIKALLYVEYVRCNLSVVKISCISFILKKATTIRSLHLSLIINGFLNPFVHTKCSHICAVCVAFFENAWKESRERFQINRLRRIITIARLLTYHCLNFNSTHNEIIETNSSIAWSVSMA